MEKRMSPVWRTVRKCFKVKRKRVAVDVDPYEYARSIDDNRTMFHAIRRVKNGSFIVFYTGEKSCVLYPILASCP